MGDRQSIAYAANNLANTAFQLGDHARARELYEETVALTSELGDRARGHLRLDQPRRRSRRAKATPKRPEQIQGEVLASIRGLGDRWIEAFALDTFGNAASRAGDREAARSLHERPCRSSKRSATGAAWPGS